MRIAARISLVGLGLSLASVATNAAATPARPSGAHPRVWLTAPTLAAMQANVAKPNSSAAKVGTMCSKLISKENEFVQAGIQGYNWAYSLGTCALSWQLGKNPAHGAAAVRIYRALLDDYVTMGDGAGGDDVVTHDTGYGMRFFGAYAGLAYDWLYDAPGVDATLRTHARARFKKWVDWYTASGYLNHTPGSNYHAGYVFAKTIIAVAEAGEDGTTSDAYWADVTDNLFPNDMIKTGLGSAGVLRGGDWAEGWQYGPMSVMEYALAARALDEQGVSFPEIRQWSDDLTRRFLYGLNPPQNGLYVAGDLDDNVKVDAPLQPRTLFATLMGPSSDSVASWAKYLTTNVATEPDLCPTYEALAEARAVPAVDFHTTMPTTTYLAKGTSNLYARGSWAKDSAFAVFTASPRMVPDHQHSDASNFVFYRGDDHLVVDPSPYGSRSTMTANAISVDSNVVHDSYKPSQSPHSNAGMPWARAMADGAVAARADFGEAFRWDDEASDVAFARRDWVFLPAGEIITIDRVRTDDAARKTYVRFRTPASLNLTANVATGVVGGSKLVIHGVALSGGTPTAAKVALDDCWTSSDYGKCAGSRFKVDEYAVNLPGPTAYAVHVIDGVGASEAPSTVTTMTDSTDNAKILGASLDGKGGARTIVISSNLMTAAAPATFTYASAGDKAARHIVFDAPEDAMGKSSVSATVVKGKCAIAITAGGANAFEGRPLAFTISNATDGCKILEDKSAPGDLGTSPPADGGADAGTTPPGGGGGGAGGGGGGAGGGGGDNPSATGGAGGGANGAANASPDGSADGGAGGCSTIHDARQASPWAALSVIGIIAVLRKRRRLQARGDSSRD